MFCHSLNTQCQNINGNGPFISAKGGWKVRFYFPVFFLHHTPETRKSFTVK